MSNTSLNFDQDYQGMMSGTAIHTQLTADGTDKTQFYTIAKVDSRPFRDAADPEWVIGFVETPDELRVKRPLGKILRDEWGPYGKDWIGKRVAFSTKAYDITDQDTGKEKTVYQIVPHPERANAFAAATGASTDVAALIRSRKDQALDDSIPF